MNSTEVLREWLLKNSFFIKEEKLIKDNSKIYLVMKGCFVSQICKARRIDYYA